MKQRGIDATTPGELYDTNYGDPAKKADAAEIARATADVDCKISTNFMGKVMAIQTAYDNQYIETHRAELDAFKKRIDDYLRTPN